MAFRMALRDKNLFPGFIVIVFFMLGPILLTLCKTLLAIHRTVSAGLEWDFAFFVAV